MPKNVRLHHLRSGGDIVVPETVPLAPLAGSDDTLIATEWTVVGWGERERDLPDGVNVEMSMRVADGVPHCVSLTFLSTRPEAGVPASVVRDFKLEDWIERACRTSPLSRYTDDLERVEMSDAAELRAIRQARARARGGYTDDLLQEVARVYTVNVDRHPTKAVREAFDVAHSTAQLYVKKARERGFLTIPAPKRGSK